MTLAFDIKRGGGGGGHLFFRRKTILVILVLHRFVSLFPVNNFSVYFCIIYYCDILVYSLMG